MTSPTYEESKKELREFVVFIAKTVNGVLNASSDGKFTKTDVFKFFEPALALQPAIEGFSKIGMSLRQLYDEDQKELYEVFKNELELETELMTPEEKATLEKMFQDTVTVGIELGMLIQNWSVYFKG